MHLENCPATYGSTRVLLHPLYKLAPFFWQVRELNNESLHLSATYPGANAHVITQGMEEVHLQWEALQAASLARKKKLRASSELQKFLSSVRSDQVGGLGGMSVGLIHSRMLHVQC